MRIVSTITLVFALCVLLLWLWSKFCEFPALAWNDLRLAPTIAFARGGPVYPTAESGTINTWTYGPLPLLLMWPASWADTAGRALLIAGALNLMLTLGVLALICFAWPTDGKSTAWAPRLMAWALCVALWSEVYLALHSADNLAIACGLTGNLLLVRARRPRDAWLAALVTTAGIGCKHVALALPAAQVLWLALTDGKGAAARYALQCVVAGLLVAAVCIAGFGWGGQWFVLGELVAHFRWAPEPFDRLREAGPELALQLAVPAVIMAAAWRKFRQRELLLPALAWACSLPLGLSALLKFGGRMNSVYSFVLWLPPVATWLLARTWAGRTGVTLRLGTVVLTAALACSRIARAPRFFLRPQVGDYADAARIAQQLRGQVWFPLHPLVTLYSEDRYYHDEDGLFVRRMTHKAVTPAHAAANLPPMFRAIAFHKNWTDFMIARHFLPETARTVTVGNWTLKIIEPATTP